MSHHTTRLDTRRFRLVAGFAAGALVLVMTACTVESPTQATPSAARPTVTAKVPTPITPSPTPTPIPEPPVSKPPEPAEDLIGLQDAIAAAIDEYWVAGRYAVAVTDLQTGESISVNGDVAQLAGCVVNLFVILQVALDLEAGRYDLEPANALIAATTWSSNADTARQLYAIAGGGDTTEGVRRVDQLIRETMELEGIEVDHPPGFHAYSLDRDYNNWVTADAVNQALAMLWSDDLLSPEWRAFVLDHLSEVKSGLNYLTASVPEGVVSHKNGFLPADNGYVDNDAGIIRLKRGDIEYAYAVTFLADEVPEKFADVVLGQQINLLAYEVMAARYPDTAAETP